MLRGHIDGKILSMIRRAFNKSKKCGNAAATRVDLPGDFYRRKLKEALGQGVEALHDPEIETRVEAYFRDNPGYSRDAVHVAAIACRFKKELVEAKAAPAQRQPVKWNIYYSCREYAREVGDPCLGLMTAPNKAEAERLAESLGNPMVGKWAVPALKESISVEPATQPARTTAIRM